MFDADCIDCDAFADHPEALAVLLAALSLYVWC